MVVRKVRRDTIQGLLQAHQDAGAVDVLQWPNAVELPANDVEAHEARAIFSDLQKGRSRAHWRPHHARLLAETSLLSGQISVMTKMLLANGSVVVGKNGHSTRSPILDALSMLVSLRGQNLKGLGLIGQHAEADGRAKGAAAARTVLDNTDNDGLLARYDDLLA
jgi:hypothetical protein